MKSSTLLWLDFAEDDFKSLKAMYKARLWRGVAVYAQQCIEKIVKAYIAEYKEDPPPKGHFIEVLIEKAGLNLETVGDPAVEKLYVAYGWARYPDLSYTHFKKEKDVKELYQMAIALYPWIKSKIQKP